MLAVSQFLYQQFFLKVSAKYTDGTDYSDEFNTVVFAIGRDACTNNIGLDKIGVQLNPKNGKVRALIPYKQRFKFYIFNSYISFSRDGFLKDAAFFRQFFRHCLIERRRYTEYTT